MKQLHNTTRAVCPHSSLWTQSWVWQNSAQCLVGRPDDWWSVTNRKQTEQVKRQQHHDSCQSSLHSSQRSGLNSDTVKTVETSFTFENSFVLRVQLSNPSLNFYPTHPMVVCLRCQCQAQSSTATPLCSKIMLSVENQLSVSVTYSRLHFNQPCMVSLLR